MCGKFHSRRGNYEAALRCYGEVTELRPEYATAFARVGYCLATLGRYQDAFDAYERALQIRPDFTSVHAHISLALERLGDTEPRRRLRKSISKQSASEDSKNAAYWHHQLGLMYCKSATGENRRPLTLGS